MIQTGKQWVRVYIRWMAQCDMTEVLQIEEQNLKFAWKKEDFLFFLRQRDCAGIVAEQGGKIMGFMVYELNKANFRILNLAVHQRCRRQSIGAQMVAKLISKLSICCRKRIILEVRETNLNAQLFFYQQGFRAVKVLRNFYKDSGEDAYLMSYCLPHAMYDMTDEEWS